MKTRIRDRQALLALSPADVMAYLRARGWKEIERIGDRGSVWICHIPGRGEFEALVPLDVALPDYTLRMGDVVQVLSEVEGRHYEEVYRDLSAASADVIRIRVRQAGEVAGMIPLEAGVALVEKARDLLSAAACAAIQPRPAFHTRRPERVTEYLHKVHLGQTEVGSYVVTLISKVPPELSQRQARLPILPEDEPFERKVTATLAIALAEARAAAELAMVKGTLDAFERAVQRGVSANLCQAIAEMVGQEQGADVAFRITWAASRPSDLPGTVDFPGHLLPVIGEAGRLLRERTPDVGASVCGYVIKLERQPEAPLGLVTILDMSEDRVRQVKIELDRQHYNLAVEAHQSGRRVTCTGDLYREGRSFFLRNLVRFHLDPSDES